MHNTEELFELRC